MLLNFCNAIDLECRENDWIYGPACEINNTIPSYTEGSHFRFTGLNESQLEEVKVLVLLNTDVSFIPEEALATFPNLDSIVINDDNFKILTSDFLSNLLKFVKRKIRNFKIYSCGLNKVDPRVIAIFQDMTEVHFDGCTYDCVFEKIDTIKGFMQMQWTLSQCIENFQPYYVSNLTYTTENEPKNTKNYQNDIQYMFSNLTTEVSENLEQIKNENSQVKFEIEKLRNEFHSKFETLTNEILLLKTEIAININNVDEKLQKILDKIH